MTSRVAAACGVALLAFSVVSLAAQSAAEADTKELLNYRLTVPAMKQFVAATRNMVTAAKADPRFGQMMKLRAELEALEAKEEMTDADQQRAEKLMAEIEALEDTVSGLSLNASENKSLSDMEAAIRREPIMANALESAGMAPRDYAKFALAFFQAAMIHGMQESGMIKEVPKDLQASVNMENVKFIAEHQEAIKTLMAEFQALGQR